MFFFQNTFLGDAIRAAQGNEDLSWVDQIRESQDYDVKKVICVEVSTMHMLYAITKTNKEMATWIKQEYQIEEASNALNNPFDDEFMRAITPKKFKKIMSEIFEKQEFTRLSEIMKKEDLGTFLD